VIGGEEDFPPYLLGDKGCPLYFGS